MTLPIDDAVAHPVTSPARKSRQATRNRMPGAELEPVLYMADIVQIVRRHRSTILRWIARKEFPAKSVPRGRPTGWLRSDIESWRNGIVRNSSDVSVQATRARRVTK